MLMLRQIALCWLVPGLVCFACSSERSYAQAPKEITNSIGMELTLIPKGTFTMGSPPGETGSRDNESQHEVTISKDYYLGIHEVTQAQYEQVMGHNPSFYQGDAVAERNPKTKRIVKQVDSSNLPVETVSWDGAVEFCQRLSALPEEKTSGLIYRLPTEAEWEYACRAGTTTAYSFGDHFQQRLNYAWLGFQDTRPLPVGKKKPNPWGLHDMHGNVWEWCSDWYGEYPQSAVSDPLGAREGSQRVYRGVSWSAATSRSAKRFKAVPSHSSGNGGFRVAMISAAIAE